MEKMSNQERHEAPAKAITERHTFKLELRKRTVEKFIWNKRHPNAGIKGYDLSKFKRKQNKGKKSCWWCGSTRHLIASCPSHKISLLKSRVRELETRIEELESAMVIKENNKKKLMRKKKKKQIKRKKKKHKLDVKVMDIAVKVRCHLLREEKSWSGVDWLKGANLIEKEPIKIKERIFRAYKKIFGRDCVEDIPAAATEGDEFFEACEKEPPGTETKDLLEKFQPEDKKNIERQICPEEIIEIE